MSCACFLGWPGPRRPHDVLQHRPRCTPGAPAGAATAAFVASALTTALLTIALVVLAPISMTLIERSDDAGWDESLLLPNQFALDAAIMGGWAMSVAATGLTFVVMRRSRSSRISC